MQGGPIVFTGLGLLVVAGVSPFLLSLGSGGDGTPPDLTDVLERARAKGTCVEEAGHMRDAHMDLLNDWRDTVVRDGQRYYERDGEQVMMSLTRTCLDCHGSREEFCTKCHDYLGVTPHCWDCHLDTVPAKKVEAGQ